MDGGMYEFCLESDIKDVKKIKLDDDNREIQIVKPNEATVKSKPNPSDKHLCFQCNQEFDQFELELHFLECNQDQNESGLAENTEDASMENQKPFQCSISTSKVMTVNEKQILQKHLPKNLSQFSSLSDESRNSSQMDSNQSENYTCMKMTSIERHLQNTTPSYGERKSQIDSTHYVYSISEKMTAKERQILQKYFPKSLL